MSTEQTADLPQGNCAEAGQITVVGIDGERYTYPCALVIEFDSTDAVREAIKRGAVEFTFL